MAVKLSGSGADKKAGFSGMATCGSTWACPVCSAKIAATRALDLAAADAQELPRRGVIDLQFLEPAQASDQVRQGSCEQPRARGPLHRPQNRSASITGFP
ncbi:hypothetical protein [Pseudarthrobacter sp. fls2-241-R2A-168]|uniref:hypothetical protein n=1 Tax=Pseudarthrobacter sp. fls2-241-R2A-168 TaxID=3040304 RepID=UPI002556E833|nr:hypothetical protein [Pseudarthrobacter sp. fls2-241-R2A-168]